MFNAKFLCDQAKFTLTELGRNRQHPSEDLDCYVKRFSERALDYSYVVDEETLIDVSLHGMLVYLENLTFSSFSKLMKAA